MTSLFVKFLPRKTFEQMTHKFGLCYLNDVNLHEGEKIEYVMNNIVLKNTECCTHFPSLGFFYPKGFFLVRF